MPDDRAVVAHLLRRTSFGPFPGQVDALAASGIDAAIEAVLGAPAVDPGEPPLGDESDTNSDAPVRHWLGLMASPDAGVHEKMVWFWHGHLTSSYDKVGSWRMMWQQHLLLREHALGNFRALVQGVTVDPAMLVYLDGDGSNADAPNENYGRELMELFTLGRGDYTQADVRAAARALSGWQVDYDGAKASFDPDSGNHDPVAYLGTTVARSSEVVDAACNHAACPGLIAAKLHRYFVGDHPSPERRDDLARMFASSGLEIRPLVEAIVRDPSFLERRLNRPRYPVEWVTAALSALGIDDRQLAYDTLSTFGQVPFYPPNVAGWPPGPRWISASHALARAALAVQAKAIAEVRDADDPVRAAFERCSMHEPSAATTKAVQDAASSRPATDNPDGRAALILAAVVSSPDFALA